MSPRHLSPADPKGLESYFTDSGVSSTVQELFRQMLATPTLSKRLLVIHGIGGVGKSSLLKMLRLHCKRAKAPMDLTILRRRGKIPFLRKRGRVPVALTSGDEAKSAVDVLSRWADDLKIDDVKLVTFAETSKRYRAIKAKVEKQEREAQEKGNKAAVFVGKVASKTAGAVGGTIVGSVLGFLVPGVGPGVGAVVGFVGGALCETYAEGWMDSLRSGEPEIDLYDPAKKLTADFLEDIDRIAPMRRLVLMLDTFEQITALDDWTRDLAQKLHPNVLLVIAGREMVNWDRQWPGWMAQAEVHPLEPMAPNVMRELVRRYFATQFSGEPDPAQVEKIIRFARGLPLVVTTAVRLWVKYPKMGDFQVIKPQVVADLADRLMEGVPREMKPVLEAAATVRWFNEEILRVVTGQGVGDIVYDELRHFPFVSPRSEGLTLHDSMREILDENLQVRDRERHRKLHSQAARYFEGRLAKVTSAEAEQFGREQLYHRVRVSEEEGVGLFQEMAEELVSNRLINRLHALLNDANTYPLELGNSCLWRDYYNARLAHLEGRPDDAEKVYQAIAENEHAEPKLRAYALCDCVQLYDKGEKLGRPEVAQRAIDVLERCREIAGPLMDSKLIRVFSYLRGVYINRGNWEQAIDGLEQQLEFFREKDDKAGLVYTLGFLKGTFGLMGDWKKALDAMARGLEILNMVPEGHRLKIGLLEHAFWVSLWSGRYSEAEHEAREGLDLFQRPEAGDVDSQASSLRDLGLASGMQGKYDKAYSAFTQSTKKRQEIGQEDRRNTKGFWGASLLKQGKLEEAKKYLIESLSIKQNLQDNLGIPELLNWLGELHELRHDWPQAESYYSQSLELRGLGRRYFECGALTGLVRVRYAQGEYTIIPQLVTEAERLAQQYEYNDYLTSLRLIQGHIAWDGHTPEWGGGFDTALCHYQHALNYALRYNRFLLDEVLSGRPQGTPLLPVVPYCLERGEEGRRMLTALRDWWCTGLNDIGTPRPDTISPIPEGIPLIEAEQIARKREFGDGVRQRAVVDQINAGLGLGDGR